MKLALQPLTASDVAHVIANLTDEDRAEIIAADIDPVAVFLDGMETSSITGKFALAGKALAIFGCRADPRDAKVGIPWMVATPEFRDHPRDAATLTLSVVESMQQAFPLLHNLVHCKHSVAQRWLTWCGFEITDEPTGPANQFFYFFRQGEPKHV